jgi:Transposase DDE domain group 1
MGLAEGPVHSEPKALIPCRTPRGAPRSLCPLTAVGLCPRPGCCCCWRPAGSRTWGQGLTDGLARWRPPRAVRDPGRSLTDLVTALALGWDCLADIAVLRAQPELCGPVASDPVVSRLVSALAADLPRALRAIRGARAAGRGRAWALAGDDAPGAGGSLIPVDIDATIVTAHSGKEKAAPTWKKSFGFHPLAAFADHGAGGAAKRWPFSCGRPTPGRTPPMSTSR